VPAKAGAVHKSPRVANSLRDFISVSGG